MANNNLFRLLQLCDPALPIGGFAHSAGLESYVQAGLVNNKKTAAAYVISQITQNIHFTDAAFVSLAFEIADNKKYNDLLQLDKECTAVKLPREIREASSKLGKRLVKLFQSFYPDSIIQQYKEAIETRTAMGHYCIAFGLLANIMKLEKEDALKAFYYNSAAGMVTNCVKLIPISQQQGQEILFSLDSLIHDLVKKSLQPERDMIGFCCTAFDIRSMQHETLYTRLYIS